MRPKCQLHKRTLRWFKWKKTWVCPVLGCDCSDVDTPGPTKHAKPKRQIIVRRDGREILQGAAWRARKMEVWQLDRCRCTGCGAVVSPPIGMGTGIAEIHHRGGKGMNGSKRDDRIWVVLDGKRVRNLETKCGGPLGCHEKASPQIQSAKLDS